jgi:hypothetical protein
MAQTSLRLASPACLNCAGFLRLPRARKKSRSERKNQKWLTLPHKGDSSSIGEPMSNLRPHKIAAFFAAIVKTGNPGGLRGAIPPIGRVSDKRKLQPSPQKYAYPPSATHDSRLLFQTVPATPACSRSVGDGRGVSDSTSPTGFASQTKRTLLCVALRHERVVRYANAP